MEKGHYSKEGRVIALGHQIPRMWQRVFQKTKILVSGGRFKKDLFVCFSSIGFLYLALAVLQLTL